MKTRTCQTCSVEYPARRGIKYCSLPCRNVGMVKVRPVVVCAACGKKYVRERGIGKKVCSMACVGELNRRRIKGSRTVPYETVQCKTCEVEFERRVADKKREFCNRSCRSRHTWDVSKLSDKMRSKTYLVTLLDGVDLKVRSRWEAAFIKDYLEKNDITWEYEPTLLLSDGTRYTPDFYLKEGDIFVEIKGFERGPSLKKVEILRSMGRTVVYADGEVLERDYGLDLRPDYLKSFTREFAIEAL